MNVKLVTYSSAFLELSWHWLNDDEIRSLTNRPEFSREQQLDWFNGLKERTDYLIWGIEADNKPVGACGLKNITDDSCEYWGYIGEKDYWGKGIGNIILQKLIEYTRDMKLESIWLNVIMSNERAIRLYKKAGFKIIENNEDNLVKMILPL